MVFPEKYEAFIKILYLTISYGVRKLKNSLNFNFVQRNHHQKTS